VSISPGIMARDPYQSRGRSPRADTGSSDRYSSTFNFLVFPFFDLYVTGTLKPHCIRCSHFKVDDVSALDPSSKPPVRIVEDNVTASLHQQRTPWPWLRPGCRDDVTWICNHCCCFYRKATKSNLLLVKLDF
jgi:hypothetical protein